MRRFRFAGWVLVIGALVLAGCKTQEPVSSPAAQPDVQRPEPSPAVVTEKPAEPVQQPVSGEVGILSAEKTEYDFGIIEPGSRNTGEFMLKNTGKGILEIDKSIHCSCGCTVPSLEKYILNPGETARMTVVYSAGEAPGSSSKYCTVKPKAPAKGELRLVVKAEVKRHISVTPEEITVPLKAGGETAQTIVIKSSDDRPFKVTRATVAGDAFAMEFDPQVSSTRHEIKITPVMDKLGDLSVGAFTFFLDHPVTKRANARYTAKLPYQAQPATIFFRDMTAKAPSQGTITIVSEFGDAVEVTEVVAEKGLAKIVSTEAKKDSYTVSVEFSVAEDNQTRILRDRIIFNLNNPYQKNIIVPVYGRVKY